MAFGGPQQIINGQSYAQYSPEWYNAMHAEAQRAAGAAGTAAGTQLANASAASGVPISGSSSSSGSGGGVGAVSNTGYTPAPRPSLGGLQAAAGGSASSYPSAPASSGGGTGSAGGAGYDEIAPVNTDAATSAEFAHAKDQVGLESSGALAGLRSALGGRGLLGGGLEERGTASAANAAAGQLGDVSRQQAMTAADLAQKNAETNFQGKVTERGQNFQKEEAGNSLASNERLGQLSADVQTRQQDIAARNASRALDIEQAQIGAQQRSTALAGLDAALKASSIPSGNLY